MVLALVCGAQFMVILDMVVVNVAIPSMKTDLGLTQSDLQWVVITYGLALGGFLLLGGRAADLFGRRKVLMTGLGLFAAASLAAGLADTLAQLVMARAVQGVGAAMISPAALSTLASTFAEGKARTKALGVFYAVAGTAGSVGGIASGLLTGGPGWEWVFLINVPLGAALIVLVPAVVPRDPPAKRGESDLLGAITVTAGLMAGVYAINKSVDHGWMATTTLGFLVGAVALLVVFVVVEQRAASPLVPLAMFRRRTFSAANVVAILLFGAFYATLFQGTLFMQQTLHYSAVETGLAWLPSPIGSLFVAGILAPRVVGRFGAGGSLVLGQVLMAGGVLYLSTASTDATYWSDLAPAFLAFGMGLGFSAMAAQVAAFSGAEDRVAGLVGGMVETARQIGGALGTAVVATVAIARADDVFHGLQATEPQKAPARGPALALTEGFRTPEVAKTAARALAQTEGFQRGSLVAAGFSVTSALAAWLLLRRAERVRAPTIEHGRQDHTN